MYTVDEGKRNSALLHQAGWEMILVRPGQGRWPPGALHARIFRVPGQNARTPATETDHQRYQQYIHWHQQKPPCILTLQRTGRGPPWQVALTKGEWKNMVRWQQLVLNE